MGERMNRAEPSLNSIAGRRGASRGRVASVIGAALLALPMQAAWAAPTLDTLGDASITPQRDLTGGETSDLLHQLQLVNGFSAPAGGGWTVIPQLSLTEELTDNVYQVRAPRRWDLISVIAPGLNIAGDLPRLQLSFSYSPVLTMYANTGSLNALTQQLNGSAHITAAPDLFYIDVRALSGVSSLYGGYGGLGGVGQQAGSVAGYGTSLSSLGLNRQNETQNANITVTPYLQRQFGDYGTARVSYSVGVTRSNTLSGFAAAPFPTGGQNSQTSISQEEIASFTTGQFLARLQDVFTVDLSQYQSTTGTGFYNGFTGLTSSRETGTRSSRTAITNAVSYQLNRTVALNGMIGHETITYSGTGGGLNTNGLTWRLGTTLTPGPDTTLTFGYGRAAGVNSFDASGHYALTARTTLTLSYQTSVGTQQQYLQNQFTRTTTNATGQLVDPTTGTPIFLTNTLARQDAVFRTEALTLGATTALDRDVVALTATLTSQSIVGAGNPGIPTKGLAATASWVHAMRPDMTVSGSVAYSQQQQGNGNSGYLGNNNSYVATLGWQYQLTQSLGMNVSYSFFDRISQQSAYNAYQNLLLVGFLKRF